MKQIDFESFLTEPVDDRRIERVTDRLRRKFEDKVRGLRGSVTYY